jgi:hypothetical protein
MFFQITRNARFFPPEVGFVPRWRGDWVQWKWSNRRFVGSTWLMGASPGCEAAGHGFIIIFIMFPLKFG